MFIEKQNDFEIEKHVGNMNLITKMDMMEVVKYINVFVIFVITRTISNVFFFFF